MFEELGMRSGTFIILIILLYYVIKWAVKNGIREAIGIKDQMENAEAKIVQEYFDSKVDK